MAALDAMERWIGRDRGPGPRPCNRVCNRHRVCSPRIKDDSVERGVRVIGCKTGSSNSGSALVTDVLPFRLPGGIDTPRVVVDLDVLDRNITNWAARMADRDVGLRPHTKTSKCIPIVQRQVDAGVVGLTVATLGEAEVLADAGFDDLFQAYPLWAGNPRQAKRLRDLHERIAFMVGVESVSSAEALGAAVRGSGRPLRVLVEVDSGLGRSGVDPADASRIAHAASSFGLEVAGAFTFGGHGYGLEGAAARAGDDEVRSLSIAAEVLSAAGYDTGILSAGSTPTAMHSARPPVTEERPGTYVFNDAQQLALGTAEMGDVALVVATTVVASHPDGRFVFDAGSKVAGADRPQWLAGYGTLPAHPDAQVVAMSEHHGVAHANGTPPSVGDTLALVPNHACATVNLSDDLMVVRAGEIIDLWPVASRGMNT